MTDEPELRPTVAYSIQETMDSDEGFRCHDCGWEGVAVPVDTDDEAFPTVCPECNGTNIENLLTTALDELRVIYDEATEERDEFVPFRVLSNGVSYNEKRLSYTLNHLLSHREAEVVFEHGTPLVAITRDHD